MDTYMDTSKNKIIESSVEKARHKKFKIIEEKVLSIMKKLDEIDKRLDKKINREKNQKNRLDTAFENNALLKVRHKKTFKEFYYIPNTFAYQKEFVRERSIDPDESFYKKFFDDQSKKAIVFEKIIKRLLSFSKACDSWSWTIEENERLKIERKNLRKERDDIIKLINQLMPKESKKLAPHYFIGFVERFPQLLINAVDKIRSNLREYRKGIKNERKYRFKDNRWIRKKAIEDFLEKDLEQLYENLKKLLAINNKHFRTKEKLKKILTVKEVYDNSDTYVAIRILSLITNSSYDRLYDTYYKYRKEIYNQINPPPHKNNRPLKPPTIHY